MPFPQTFQNRTRDAAAAELVQYLGGVGRSDALNRAQVAWDAAVREFNSVAWRFNIATQDITLDGSGSGTATYALNDLFRAPVRCKLLDSNNFERKGLIWYPYAEWLVQRPDQLTGSNIPRYWTAQNTHETGLVTFDPRPQGTLTYPKARVYYAKWIQLQPSGTLTLDVPPDVDEAIFQLATAKLIAKNKNFSDSHEAYGLAASMRLACERNYRIWGEATIVGING